MMLFIFDWLLTQLNNVLTNQQLIGFVSTISGSYQKASEAVETILSYANWFVDRQTLTIVIVNYSLMCGILLTIGLFKFILKTIDELPFI